MIDAAGRGAVPIQLAATEMGRSQAAARAERPLAIALEVIGMHLARGERLTTPEVRHLVALMDATLDVFSAAAPPAAPTQVVLKAARVAIREFQRDARQMLTQHQELTATLLPILDRLIVAVAANHAEEAPTVDRPPVTDHGVAPAAIMTPVQATPPPPPLAKLLASLIEAIAHLQPLLMPEPTLVQTLSEAITQLKELTPDGSTAAPVAQAIVQLEELVVLLTRSPAAAPPAEVANAIAQVIEQVTQLVAPPAEEILSTTNPPSATNAPSEPIGPSATNAPSATMLPSATNPPSATNAPSEPIGPPTGSSSSAQAAPTTGSFPSAPNSPSVPTPPAAPTLQTAVAQIIANLQAVIVSTELTENVPTALLLNAAAPAGLDTEQPVNSMPPQARLENLDAYRWAMLAALSAWQAPRRPLSGRAGPSARRCSICGRLLEPTGTEALLCPTCQLY